MNGLSHFKELDTDLLMVTNAALCGSLLAFSTVVRVLGMCSTEEQPCGEGAHYQAAEGGVENRGGQAGAAEEATTKPDPEG